MKNFQIAIDGPVAAGKSTVAKILAERLGFLYVDTGAMYRAVALKAQRECVQWVIEEEVIGLLSTLNLELDKPNGQEADGRLVTVLLDGQDVSQIIRRSDIAEGASIVSSYEAVREVLVTMQQNISAGENVVMEGRDIGSVVLPRAQLKIYLDAHQSERVARKYQELKSKGFGETKAKVKEDLVKRDTREMTRKATPLKPAKDAWILDSTDKSIEEVVEEIMGRVGKLNT